MSPPPSSGLSTRSFSTIPGTERPYQSTSVLPDEGRSEGYDEYFDPPLESRYECPICLLGLREPVQTSCGHRFCEICLLRSFCDAGPKCPIDDETLSLNQLYPDNFAKREMMSLTVACRNKKTKGCDWKGPLGDLQSHLKECLKIPVECKHCDASIPSDEMDDHLNRYCLNVEDTCPIKGCSFKGPRRDVKKHFSENLVDHMYVLAITVREMSGVLTGKYLSSSKSMTGAAGPQQSSDMNMQQLFEDLSNKVRNIQHETDELRRNGNEQSTLVTLLERRQEETRVRHDRHLQEINHMQTRQETKLSEYEGRVLNGTYIWRIDNFRERRQDAINGTQTEIYSPPFFTAMYGHKMCMRIHLNGVNSSVGKYISLYVHMMKCEWDEVIEWPFTGRITMSILDQSENVKYRQHIMDTSIAEPNMASCKRPTAELGNMGYGCPELGPIEALVDGKYIKNNVMLVKIQIFSWPSH